MLKVKLQLSKEKELTAMEIDTQMVFSNIVSVTIFRYKDDNSFRGSFTTQKPYSSACETYTAFFTSIELEAHE